MGFQIEDGVLKKYTEEDGVTEVVIPDGVTSIGDWAFSYCESLSNKYWRRSIQGLHQPHQNNHPRKCD